MVGKFYQVCQNGINGRRHQENHIKARNCDPFTFNTTVHHAGTDGIRMQQAHTYKKSVLTTPTACAALKLVVRTVLREKAKFAARYLENVCGAALLAILGTSVAQSVLTTPTAYIALKLVVRTVLRQKAKFATRYLGNVYGAVSLAILGTSVTLSVLTTPTAYTALKPVTRTVLR
ncbi:hypothetical protein ElyMa_004853200 [Elysia marginata]|uniref:Uncharacterized protein n=1 Tax=Elysia marginata TaxID=1093978 RepID=A0AAV4IS05_9GAST|nr:hypothetical protein ElyMa_004853200 [Elysia marginata]